MVKMSRRMLGINWSIESWIRAYENGEEISPVISEGVEILPGYSGEALLKAIRRRVQESKKITDIIGEKGDREFLKNLDEKYK